MNTISFAHTLDKVLAGEKTQTRRVVKPMWMKTPEGIVNVKTQFDNIKTTNVFKIGGIHTVVAGRGKPTVGLFPDGQMVTSTKEFQEGLKFNGWKPLQIRVVRIRVEDVRDISPDDVKAEGFTSYAEFMETWCGMHDKSAHKAIAQMRTNLQMIAVGRPNYIEDKTWALLKERPDNRYQAVVLDFEVVK